MYFNRRRRKSVFGRWKSINQQQKNSEEKFKCAKRYLAVNGRAVNKITLTTCVGRQDARRKFNLNWMSLLRVFRALLLK